MTDNIRVEIDTQKFSSQVDDVRRELTSLLEDDIAPLAGSMRAAFQELGEGIASDLEAAAARGSISMRDMVNSVLDDLARLAADQLVRAPLEQLLNSGRGGGSIGIPSDTTIGRSSSQAAAQLARSLARGGRNG